MLENIKCIKCDKEAKFESPDYYCSYHWCEWWADGMADKNLELELWQAELEFALDIEREHPDNNLGEINEIRQIQS
jgi:hypothetical protein